MISKLIKLLLLVVVATTSFVVANVDTSLPDLSRFNLRKVNAKQFAQDRATQQLEKLSSGAMSLRESIYIGPMYVRCSAYAHLFRLIKRQQPVHKDTVESLALVAGEDQRLYGYLFRRYADSSSVDNYLEAIKELELNNLIDNNQLARDTWLELINCSFNYLTGRLAKPEMASFLNEEPRRSAGLNYRPPSLVSDQLVRKFEELQGEDANLATARELVEKLDDEETAALRGKLLELPEFLDVQLEKLDYYERSEARSNGNDADDDDLEDDNDAIPIDLLVPSEFVRNSKRDEEEYEIRKQIFSPSQLIVLQLIKMRILNNDRSDARHEMPRIPMSAALDYQGNWMALQLAILDKSSDFGERASAFRRSKKNKELANRVKKLLDDYVDVWVKLDEVQRLSASGRLTNMEQLREPSAELERMLDRMDRAFDLEHLRRIVKKWRRQMVEYDAMDKFISKDHW